ncbi:MAG: TraB/GumN family protein [Saprospiraceae bacterium]|nr:TraB/GumN family protein [Saprospiraceae bacterium]
MFKTIAIFFTITFSVISFHNLNAQEQLDSENPRQDKLENSLLWKVSGNGIKTSYIFGTIHMISKTDFFWDKNMDKAFKKSKKLVMEIDMSQSLVMAVQMMQLAPMKGDQTLKDLISEQDYEIVKKYFTEEVKSQEAKMTFGMGQNWQPMLLQSGLYMEMIDGPVKMYEMELTAKARKADMAFGGLETVAEQMAVFNQIPYKVQAEELVKMVKNLKEGKGDQNEFAMMVTKYKEQDIDGMLESMQEDLDAMEGKDALLDDRNKKWIPKIGEISKEMPTFFAVGAGHLGGENGVIRLLRKAGYKVVAMK